MRIYRLGTKFKYDQDTEPIVNSGYSVETGKLYAYQRVGDELTVDDSGQGTLYYLKAERIDPTTGLELAPNTGDDITLDLRWYEWVKNYAVYKYLLDKGSDESLAKAKVFQQTTNEILPSKD